MTVTPQELRDRAAIQNGNAPKDQQKTESVVKFFMDSDKIAAIKAMDTRITVGTPPTQITIKPLSPKGMAESYLMIRQLIVPVLSVVMAQQSGRVVQLDEILEAFGENIALLPELIFKIIQRGNSEITREWCDEHLDFMLDLQLILPLFIQQNGLDRLFSGKKQAGSTPTVIAPATELTTPPPTEELQAPSTSASDGTDQP